MSIPARRGSTHLLASEQKDLPAYHVLTCNRCHGITQYEEGECDPCDHAHCGHDQSCVPDPYEYDFYTCLGTNRHS